MTDEEKKREIDIREMLKEAGLSGTLYRDDVLGLASCDSDKVAKKKIVPRWLIWLK